MATFLVRHRWTMATVAAALLVAFVYVISLDTLPKHVFWMPDEGAKLFQLESCSLSWKEGIAYRIPFASQRLLPGNDFLPGFDVFPEPRTMTDGSLYLEFDTPVVFPLVTAPFYHAFGAVGLYVLPMVSGWLVAVLTGVMAWWFAPVLAPFAILLVGLATPVWFYSLVFWEHTLATLLGLLAVALVVQAPTRVERIAVSVPLILVATMFRTEMAVLGAALVVAWLVVAVNAQLMRATEPSTPAGLYAMAGGWRLVLLSLAATVAAAAVLKVSVTVRHRAIIGILPQRIHQAFSGIAHVPQGLFEVFINSQNLGPRVGVAWIVAATVAVLVVLVAPLLRSGRDQAALVIAGLALMVPCSAGLILTGEPYRGLHGLFPIAPFTILWPFALRDAWRRRDAPLLALGTATWVYLLGSFAALAVTYINRGELDVGMQWGQRYMLTAYPMLAILSLVAVRRLRASFPSVAFRTALITLVALLVACGVGLEIRGLRMLQGTRGIMAEWDQALRAEDPIVTTVWWIVPTVADLTLTHDMFFTWPAGVPHFVEEARSHGVTEFTFAHTEPITDETLGAAGIRRVSDTRTIKGGLLLTRFHIDPLPAR